MVAQPESRDGVVFVSFAPNRHGSKPIGAMLLDIGDLSEFGEDDPPISVQQFVIPKESQGMKVGRFYTSEEMDDMGFERVVVTEQ